jgi:hypothetical protein
MTKRVAIIQSNYIPWKGYFDILSRVDEFILYDSAQYTRRDWRNRNQIKTPQGPQWLTIPVQSKGQYVAPIREIAVDGHDWAEKHWRTLELHYKKAPGFARLHAPLRALYEEAARLPTLSEVNRLFLTQLGAWLGVATPLRWSWEYEAEGDKSDKLLSMCLAARATTYLSGPSARGYLDVARFEEAGVAVEWMDYSGYPEYPQLYPPFTHAVSVVDLLLSAASDADARAWMRQEGGRA